MDVPRDPIEFWTAFGALAAVVAAVGTIAAFAIAFYQISIERSARRKDERSAIATEQVTQARKISGWIGGTRPTAWGLTTSGVPPTPATLLNASDEPVYQVVAWLVLIQGAGPQTGEQMREVAPDSAAALATLPPGRFVVSLPGDWGGMMARPGVEIAFTDAAGRHWIRRANGLLDQILDDPVEHYAMSRPVNWQVPTPSG